MGERMFVVVHHGHFAGHPERPRVHTYHPDDSADRAEELAGLLRDVALAGGRQRDVYRVYELVAAEPERVDRLKLRAAATGGGTCPTCSRPFFTHVCLSCSPDAQTPGPGCANCRDSGMDQTPCLPANEVTP